MWLPVGPLGELLALGSLGLSWSLLVSPELSWALLGSSGLSWAVLGSPGFSLALLCCLAFLGIAFPSFHKVTRSLSVGFPMGFPWPWDLLVSPGFSYLHCLSGHSLAYKPYAYAM